MSVNLCAVCGQIWDENHTCDPVFVPEDNQRIGGVMSKPFRCRLGLHHWHYFGKNILMDDRTGWPLCYYSERCTRCQTEHTDIQTNLKHWFLLSEIETWDNLKHSLEKS